MLFEARQLSSERDPGQEAGADGPRGEQRLVSSVHERGVLGTDGENVQRHSGECGQETAEREVPAEQGGERKVDVGARLRDRLPCTTTGGRRRHRSARARLLSDRGRAPRGHEPHRHEDRPFGRRATPAEALVRYRVAVVEAELPTGDEQARQGGGAGVGGRRQHFGRGLDPIKLGVGASSAMSFRYDLHTVGQRRRRDVHAIRTPPSRQSRCDPDPSPRAALSFAVRDRWTFPLLRGGRRRGRRGVRRHHLSALVGLRRLGPAARSVGATRSRRASCPSDGGCWPGPRRLAGSRTK